MVEIKENTILIVDDVPDNIDILSGILKDDYNVMAAPNGEIALKITQSETPPDIILLDIMMPVMDGFEVCRLLKEDPRTEKIPVVFVTATVDQVSIDKGIELGAYYYLTKPVHAPMVKAIVKSALSQFSEYKDLQKELENTESIMELMTSGSFNFRTLEETRNLALNLAKMAPEPAVLVMGLTELMVNAVEHGNLGITYDEKNEFSAHDGWWLDEVERRLALPENVDKLAKITIERSETEIRFTITDHGQGFDWLPYLEIDADRAEHSNGRGIAMSNMLTFSKIEFQGTGNEVIAVYSLS